MWESEAKLHLRAARIAIIGAGCAAVALALSPAISAVVGSDSESGPAKVSLKMLGSIGSFTPVTRDARLAKAYAEAARESQTRGFRFTPASGALNGERSLTVLVRATSNEEGTLAKRGTTPTTLGIAPVAYNLGRAKGLERFVASNGIAAREQEQPMIESSVQMPTANFVLQSKRNRFSTNLQVEARDVTATAPTNETPQTLGQEKTYTVDLSSSFSLTRNLDVQAGLRYRGPDNRLVPVTDQAQDSQAVYVGTKFKF